MVYCVALYFQKIKRKLSSERDDLSSVDRLPSEEGKSNEASVTTYCESISQSKIRKTDKCMSRPGRFATTDSSKIGLNQKVQEFKF